MKNPFTSGQVGSTPGAQFTNLAPYYDELMQDVPYEAWVEYVRLLFKIAENEPQAILDCACGTGNISFALAAYNYDVTGVDLSADMIARAQAKLDGLNTPLPLKFLQADLTSFQLNQTFDAATCLYDSFNYILAPERLEAAFARIAAHIRQGGVFVFDMNTPWAFEANLFSQQNRDPRRNLHYRWRADYDSNTRICSVAMQFERKMENNTVQRFAETHRERAYDREEIQNMLERSGWTNVRAFDAYTLNAPHKRSERWYFLARRA
jgi:ubiquinone/menaquinone biosynthesis C-methylase UbiE